MSRMQTNPKPGHLIVERINKTRRQVRTIELVTTLVTLAACLLLFLLVSVVVDHWVFKNGTPLALRYLGLAVVIGAGVAYFVLRLIPLIRFSVNPAYAAEVLEKWNPDMKNRLLNWVFLQREKRDKSSPTAQTERLVLESVGRETAANLNTIPDQLVVDCSAMIRWGVVLACVLAMFCLYIVLSPKNTLQSVGRAATPFVNIEAPQSIVIKEVEPGDATVYQGETLQIKARLDKATRKPVHVVYSTDDGRLVDQRVPMQGSDDGMRFECRFPPGKRGFEESLTYRVEVGDGRSKTFAVTVNPSIAIDVKSVEYNYPAYTKLPARTVENSGDLRAVEGTRVTIIARSNIAMSQATLMPDGDAARAVKLALAPSKTEARGMLTLGFDPNQPTKPVCTSYTLRCWDADRQTNPLPSVYRVEVVRDESPIIKWADRIDDREPLQVALNEPFDVAVEAQDPDFGLRQVQLLGTVTRVAEAVAQRAGNTLPETNELPLEAIALLKNPPRTGTVTIKKTMVASKLGLRAGDRIAYFAEAVDTKDPSANTAVTPPRVFIVTEPDPDKPLDPPVNDEPQEQGGQDQNDQQNPSDESDAGSDNDQNGGQDSQNSGDNQGDKQSENQDQNDGAEQKQSQSGSDAGKESTPEAGNESGEQKQSDQPDKGQNQQNSQPQDSSEQKSDQQDKRDGAEGQRQQQNAEQQNGDKQQQKDPQQQQQDRGTENDTSNTGDPDQSGGDPEQQNKGGGKPSGETNGASNDRATGGSNNTSNDGANQRQGNNGQQNQPGQGTQNGGANSGNREKLDGESNPGDVVSEVLDHMRENGDLHDEGHRPGNEDSANQLENQQNARNDQQPQNGELQPGGKAPDQTPEHDDTRSTDQTDAFRTRDGNDLNAEQLDPNSDKPIYGGPDDTGADATEANETGRQLTDDQSRDESPQRENARPVDPNNPDESGRSGMNTDGSQQEPQQPEERQQNDRGNTDRQNDPREGPPNGLPGGEETQSPPQQSGNEHAGVGNGEQSGSGGGGHARNPGEVAGIDSTPEHKADAANLEYTRQATDLAIRYLEDELGKERPDPRLLERLGGWSENDLRRFVDHWKEMQQQSKRAPGTKEGQKLDETLRNIGTLAPKATVGRQRNNASQSRTVTTESQRYAPPKGKYEDLMKAYSEGIGK